MSVFEALGGVMADVQAVGKNEKNAHFNYKFRGIDAVVNAVGPALREHGVIIAPTRTVHHSADVTTSKGKASRQVTLTVDFTAWGPGGDSVTMQVAGEAMDDGDKATAKAHSVAYRTALLQLLCIPTDEPDPDESSYERVPARSREPLADEATRTELGDRVAALDADDTDTLKTWWREHLTHKLVDLTAREATSLRTWLDDNQPAEEAPA